MPGSHAATNASTLSIILSIIIGRPESSTTTTGIPAAFIFSFFTGSLLIDEGSLLLELQEIRGVVEPYDSRALVYPWRNPDPFLDRLCATIQEEIKQQERRRASRTEVFRAIWDLAGSAPLPEDAPRPDRATIPYLTEPWYC